MSRERETPALNLQLPSDSLVFSSVSWIELLHKIFCEERALLLKKKKKKGLVKFKHGLIISQQVDS